ncbi:hypothetical protein AB0N23_02535 [Streptomyces sp. NPDC052644]
MERVVIDQWNGRTAALLQEALRLTNERFAERLGVAVRTIANWRARPDLVPSRQMQQLLDIAYEQASEAVCVRFAANFAPLSLPAPAPAAPGLGVEMELLRTQVALLQKELELLRMRSGQ